MLVRTTVWHDADRLDVVQVAVCVLDDDWEPIVEATQEVGPFDTLDEQLGYANDFCRAFLERCGIQQALPF